MGRHLAQALEAELLLEFILKALDPDPSGPTIVNVNPEEPISDQAYALSNAARGDLLHYLQVDQGRVRRYQAVVPTTWNFSPRDENGLMGANEVKELSRSTHKATKAIDKILSSIRNEVEGAVNLLKEGVKEAETGQELASEIEEFFRTVAQEIGFIEEAVHRM